MADLTQRPDPGSITRVAGVRVGHASDSAARTGVTAILFDDGAIGAGLLMGSAASTRGFESLYPRGVAKPIHGVCFAGGSTFGLAAGGGVQRYLRDRGRGARFGEFTIPLVPCAVIFDLALGAPDAYPDEAMAHAACERAGVDVQEGNVGAGSGALVGKLFGHERAMCGGVGTASSALGDWVVGALAVVNPFGDVLSPDTGAIMAGLRTGPYAFRLANSAHHVREGHGATPSPSNTTLVAIATNVPLTSVECGVVTRMAAAGVARAIAPIFSPFDGDVIIAVSTAPTSLDARRRAKPHAKSHAKQPHAKPHDRALTPLVVGQIAADMTAVSIFRAVMSADPVGDIPGVRDFRASRVAGRRTWELR